MNYYSLAILVVASLADIALASLLFIKDKKSSANVLFILLVLSLVGWAAANYFSVALSEPSGIFLAIKVLMAFVVIQNTFFLLFVSVYPKNLLFWHAWPVRVYISASIIIALSSIYPGFFSGYSSLGKSISPEPGPLLALFIIHTVFSVSLILYRLVADYIKSSGLERNQYLFLFAASAILLVVAPISSFILPVGFHEYALIPFGPIYTLTFAGVIFYSMAKYRLFDIHTFIVRAAAYVFSISLLSLLYVVPSFLLVAYVMGLDLTWLRFVGGVIVAILFAFFYGQASKSFNTITNKLFYRGYYEPQELYDQLNKTLVASQTMDEIVMKSLSIIETKLRPEFAFVGLKGSNQGERIFGSRKVKFDPKDIAAARKITKRIHHKVIVAEHLDESRSSEAQLKDIMDRNGLGVIVRLTHDVRPVEEGLGYLLLGHRKSGSSYSQKDVVVLDTVANEMVVAIQNALHVEEIQHFNITLQHRVDEATRRLRQTNKRLKLLDETKDDFISMASHQLRTPLTSVKGYLSMVLEGDAGKINPTQKKMLEQAFASSQRMVYLIADLLNVSRLRTGKFVIEHTEVDLASVVEQEISQVKETAESRQVKLNYSKPKTFPTLMLDDTKIRQVIMNFIDNAIYYTPAGGEIKVRLDYDDQSVSLKVVDNGIGVAKPEQHRLFTKFFRATNARQARPDGTGLGLFMASKVVLAQGGHVIFNSVENKGSTFGFSFPLKRAVTSSIKPEKEPAKKA